MLSKTEMQTLEILKQERKSCILGNIVSEMRLREKASLKQEMQIYGYVTKENDPPHGAAICRMTHSSGAVCFCGHIWIRHDGHRCVCCSSDNIGNFEWCEYD